MMRAITNITILLASALASSTALADDRSFPFYVGKDICLSCHAEASHATACTVESMPKHGTSYETLSKPQAADIAKLNGILEPPTQSRICLDCHATAADEGPRWTAQSFRIQHGVQCESCHDAGSFHVAHWRARENGSVPRRPDRIQPGNRTRCDPCHVKRPSHREVLEFGYTVPIEDRRYKTPVNLAVSPNGDRLYVVCQYSDSVVVIDPATGSILHEIEVGRRPHGIAVSPDGSTLYVTNRMGDSLSVIDTATKLVVDTIAVGHEPHGVVTDPTGRFLFIADTGEDNVAIVDTQSLRVTKRLAAGQGPWSLALSADKKRCYVTNVRPNLVRFRDPTRSEITVIDVNRQVVVQRRSAEQANMLQGIAAVADSDLMIFTQVRTKNLIPSTRLQQGWTITNGLGLTGSHDNTDGSTPPPCDQVLLDQPNDYFPDPTDIAVSPDGTRALVTSGGTDKVALIDVTALTSLVQSHSQRDRAEILPNHLGMSHRFVLRRIDVGVNPRSVAYSPDGRFAFVANALDDTVTVLETERYTTAKTIPLGGPDKITQIRRGERLFHSADITFGRQFSCRSCHPDGHVNGLTFDIEADGLGLHPVDNRTLRGILDTPPFKWEGTNPTIHHQCGPRLAVFFTRLEPYTPDELAALVRYISTIEKPPNPNRHPDGLTMAQRRGKAVFERTVTNAGQPLPPEQRCAHCHNGAYKTNRTKTQVASTMWFDAPVEVELGDLFNTDQFGELGNYYFVDAGTPTVPFDVPHLRNIYNSAPYLHNGAARTLEEIWTRFNLVNRHGMTGDMNRRQYNDLIAYLKSL